MFFLEIVFKIKSYNLEVFSFELGLSCDVVLRGAGSSFYVGSFFECSVGVFIFV